MTEETKHPGGRPSSFTEETASTICERLMAGESLRKICRDADMPDQVTVYRWISQNDEFRKQYAHAREVQGETYADQIADEAFSATDAALGRLKMDALKWSASKLAPKKYGDKVALEHTGKDGGPIQTYDLSKVPDDKLAQLQEILEQALPEGSDPA